MIYNQSLQEILKIIEKTRRQIWIKVYRVMEIFLIFIFVFVSRLQAGGH
jgi:hypothetical protein